MELRSQRWAQRAYAAVESRRNQAGQDKYLSFARAFPTLLHTCGLTQATAYAAAKEEQHAVVLEDLARVLGYVADSGAVQTDKLLEHARTKPVIEYLRLSREALAGAGWIKRYVQALSKEGDAE